jgi:acyl carrier protein
MDDELMVRVAELAADVFGEDVVDVGPGTTPDDIEGWDSLAQLNLIVALEDEFGVRISPDDIEAMTSIAAVADVVRRHV